MALVYLCCWRRRNTTFFNPQQILRRNAYEQDLYSWQRLSGIRYRSNYRFFITMKGKK